MEGTDILRYVYNLLLKLTMIYDKILFMYGHFYFVYIFNDKLVKGA